MLYMNFASATPALPLTTRARTRSCPSVLFSVLYRYKFEGTVSYLRDLLSHRSITQEGNANLSPNIGNSFVHKHKSVCSDITFLKILKERIYFIVKCNFGQMDQQTQLYQLFFKPTTLPSQNIQG